ncbi:hypothetical protein [Geodermatophilus sp. DSM 45219]|uniref:hypothetical protein n=1 Tax=Geodermatophilus sp. DSM 45219 TaxID=1881103 RepID=UPI00088D94F9|nr:hypothetical protein [Geodermatophilus sp. DSM 45219]SDN41407.1 hypothetical protein SAMN05428965_0292 [Geodermatophilus sp. DSM 45219]
MSIMMEDLLPADQELELYGDPEDEYFGDPEFESASSPAAEIRLMEHLAAMAAQTESESEAEAFLGALPALAARLAPAAARWVPELTKRAVQVGRQLWNSPAARPYVQALPHVVRRTTADVAGRYSRGAPVSLDLVTRRFAHHASRALRDPRRRRRVVQRSRQADRAWIAEARRRAQQANRVGPGRPAAVPGRSIVVNGQRWCRC